MEASDPAAVPAIEGENAEATGCPGAATVRWDGPGADTPGKVGDGVNWTNPYNWNLDCVPGAAAPFDDTAVIGAGFSVTLGRNEGAAEGIQVRSLDNQGALLIAVKGRLVTLAASRSRTTTLRGILAGKGPFEVTESFDWAADSLTAPLPMQATRWCERVNCAAPVAANQIGITRILPGAVMRIGGLGLPGGQLSDQRVVDNLGTVRLLSGGLVADRGTEFRNQGLYDVTDGSGELYREGAPGTFPTLSRFVNTGTVRSARLGTLLADYSGSGQLELRRGGSLAVSAGELRATVSNTGALSTTTALASCRYSSGLLSACPRGTDATDRYNGEVLLTRFGQNGTRVAIEELPQLPVPAIRFETVGAVSSPSSPIIFTITVDRSVLGVANFPLNAKVQRGGATTPYVDVPRCDAFSDQPTAARPTCYSVPRSQAASGSPPFSFGFRFVVLSIETGPQQRDRYRVTMP